VAFLADSSAAERERFLAVAERRRAYDRRDPEPCDISIVPRVVTAAQAAEFGPICRRIVRASIERVLDLQAGREPVASVPLAWIAGLVPRPPAEFMGNVRLDFLLERGRPRLLEGGWVNLSAVDYAPQAALACSTASPRSPTASTSSGQPPGCGSGSPNGASAGWRSWSRNGTPSMRPTTSI
jgi:hypothetical protein